MPDKHRVVIVGAGPGGLGAAMLLASRGFSVTVFEKQREIGGRSGALSLGDYTFDIGSTLLMMTFVIDEIFELAGRRLADELEIVHLDPMYRLDFGDRMLDMYSDPVRMEDELRRFAPGSEPGLLRFLEREHDRLEHLYPLLQRNWPNMGALADRSVLMALPYVGLTHSLHDTASEYFDDEKLQLGFSFQSAYLGMSPWNCPGGFGMVPYAEHAWGVDYIQGGIHRLCAAMARVARENGALIRTGAEVTQLQVEDDRCTAVLLASGERLTTDSVIIDADAAAALTSLLDRDVSARFDRHHLQNLRESCSTFMMYLGLDTQLPLIHHTFFFAEDYQGEMRRVFNDGVLADDISLYVCNPVVTDPSVAPPGHTALYLLALAPNTRAGIDWRSERARMRRRVLSLLKRRTGIDVSKHIVEERSITPSEWESRYHISHGAVFGPAHNIGQLLALRLPNKLPSPHNVYLTGGGTNPGSGIPTILESARIACRLLCDENGIEFPESRALPEPATWKCR